MNINRWQQYGAKYNEIQDHLARELHKDKLRLLNKQHIRAYDTIAAWIAEKEAYLNTKETCQSISDAQVQLSLLEAYEKESKTTSETRVARLKNDGAAIIADVYHTAHSVYHWESPDEIHARGKVFCISIVTLMNL